MRIARYYQQTLFAIFALFGIIVVSITFLFQKTVDEALVGNYVASGKAIARSIADSNVDVIVNQNYSALQSVIDQFVGVGGISYVFVVDETGSIIAHTFVPGVPGEIMVDFREPKPVHKRQIPGMGSITEVTSKVLAGEAGTVHIGLDDEGISFQIQRAIGTQVYLLAIIFVLSVVTIFVAMYRVTRPIEDLCSYARNAVFGDEEAEAPSQDQIAPVMERIDEVGELGRLLRVLKERSTPP